MFNQEKWSHKAHTNTYIHTYTNIHDVTLICLQVYGNAWTAVMLELDNPGIWNIRSQEMQRQWQGQEFYLQVVSPSTSSSKRQEAPPPDNLLLCGKAIKQWPQQQQRGGYNQFQCTWGEMALIRDWGGGWLHHSRSIIIALPHPQSRPWLEGAKSRASKHVKVDVPDSDTYLIWIPTLEWLHG